MIGPFPLKLPIVDIHTIGAGGGSIAAVTSAGRLTVGPRSAGAEPGPVCYRRGGSEPTVTDAHLVLGRIPAALLGGELPLDVPAAREAIAARIGRPLGLGVEEAAAGVVEIVDNTMARAIRTVSVGRGHDPRRFALVAFGGAGPAPRLPPGRAARHPDRDHPAAAGRAVHLGPARHRHPLDLRAHRGHRRAPAGRGRRHRWRSSRAPGLELERQAQAWLDGRAGAAASGSASSAARTCATSTRASS